MRFKGQRFTVTNIRDYEQTMPHAMTADPEYVQVWDDPTDVWDYDQLAVTVEDDEVLVLESNQTAGQGRYIAVEREAVQSLMDEEVLESTQ